MRKKLKMRSGGKVAKYAEGGAVKGSLEGTKGLLGEARRRVRDLEEGLEGGSKGSTNDDKPRRYKAGGRVAKYAEGGRVGGPRPQEDRAAMAAEAAAGFDAEEERAMARRAARARPPQDNPWARGESILTNRPVGAAPRAAATPARMPSASDMAADGPMAGSMAGAPAERLPTPPRPPRRASAAGGGRARARGMSADDLNARELERLGVTSIAPANRYRKGGMVSAKKGKK